MQSNPFASPGVATERQPLSTSLTIWGMTSSLGVGASLLEVQTGHWSGREIYRVDGVVVSEVRNLGWHHTERLVVDGHDVRIVARWYPVLPVAVYVDDALVLRDLFPQVRVVQASIAAVVLPIALMLSGSIAYDLIRLYLLFN